MLLDMYNGNVYKTSSEESFLSCTDSTKSLNCSRYSSVTNLLRSRRNETVRSKQQQSNSPRVTKDCHNIEGSHHNIEGSRHNIEGSHHNIKKSRHKSLSSSLSYKNSGLSLSTKHYHDKERSQHELLSFNLPYKNSSRSLFTSSSSFLHNGSCSSEQTDELLEKSVYQPVNMGGDLNTTIQSTDETVLEILTPRGNTTTMRPFGVKEEGGSRGNTTIMRSFSVKEDMHSTMNDTSNSNIFHKLDFLNSSLDDHPLTERNSSKQLTNSRVLNLSDISSSSTLSERSSMYRDSVVELLKQRTPVKTKINKSNVSIGDSISNKSQSSRFTKEYKIKNSQKGLSNRIITEKDSDKKNKTSTLLSPEYHKLKNFFSNQKDVSIRNEEVGEIEIEHSTSNKMLRFETINGTSSPRRPNVSVDRRNPPTLPSDKKISAAADTSTMTKDKTISTRKFHHKKYEHAIDPEMEDIDRILTELRIESGIKLPTRDNVNSSVSTEKQPSELDIDDLYEEYVSIASNNPAFVGPTQNNGNNRTTHTQTTESKTGINSQIASDITGLRNWRGTTSPVSQTTDITPLKDMLQTILEMQNENSECMQALLYSTLPASTMHGNAKAFDHHTDTRSDKTFLSVKTDKTLEFAKQVLMSQTHKKLDDDDIESIDFFLNDSPPQIRDNGMTSNYGVAASGKWKKYAASSDMNENKRTLHSNTQYVDGLEQSTSQLDQDMRQLKCNNDLLEDRIGQHTDIRQSGQSTDRFEESIGQLETLKQMLFQLQSLRSSDAECGEEANVKSMLSKTDENTATSYEDDPMTRACKHLENLRELLKERKVTRTLSDVLENNNIKDTSDVIQEDDDDDEL